MWHKTPKEKKTKDSGFSSVKGVAKKVLREPDLLESGISFLQKKLESNKGTTRISAMEEIGSIAEETRYLLNSFPKQREDTIRKMLLDCAHSIQPFLFSESKEETEGSLRTLTAIEHCPALPDMIKCLDEQDVCLEAIWCLGKFETKAAAAASKLMLIINNQQSRMGSYPYDFSVVEAALLSLESIGYVPTAEDNVFGILVRDKDASIAAVTCRLLARNSQLAKTYVDSIKIYLADKRGRLSDSARDALAAARK